MASQKNRCLSAVLKYMEPNLRFMLSARAPQLRPFNTSAPIHLQYLEFEPLQTTINNHTYQLRIYKEWHPGHTEYGPSKTVDQDLDRFGFEMDPDRLHKIAGDVDLRDTTTRHQESCQKQKDNSEIEAEQRVRFYEDLLAKKLKLENQEDEMVRMFENAMDIGKEQEPENMEEVIFQSQNPIESEDSNRHTSILLAHRTSEDLQISLTIARARYLPYQCRRAHVTPPYTPYLQLTVSWPTGIQHYRMRYSMKLNEALKKINSFFFKGRYTIKVKDMVVDPEVKLLRIPSGLQFRPRNLSTPIKAFCNSAGIFDRSTLVLNSLTVKNVTPKRLMSCHLPGSSFAKTMIIENSFSGKESWPTVLKKVYYKHVELRNEGKKFRSEEALELIKYWMEGTGYRSQGSTVTFGLKKKSTAKKFLKAVKKQFKPEKAEKTFVVLPRKYMKSKLVVSYQELERNQRMMENRNESRCILKLEIGKAENYGIK